MKLTTELKGEFGERLAVRGDGLFQGRERGRKTVMRKN